MTLNNFIIVGCSQQKVGLQNLKDVHSPEQTKKFKKLQSPLFFTSAGYHFCQNCKGTEKKTKVAALLIFFSTNTNITKQKKHFTCQTACHPKMLFPGNFRKNHREPQTKQNLKVEMCFFSFFFVCIFFPERRS